MTNVARYANGHLFSIYESRSALEEQIAMKLGDCTEEDFEKMDKFAARIVKISDFASERNCHLYVDAE